MFDTPNHQIRSLLAAFEASVGASFRSIAGVATQVFPQVVIIETQKDILQRCPLFRMLKGNRLTEVAPSCILSK